MKIAGIDVEMQPEARGMHCNRNPDTDARISTTADAPHLKNIFFFFYFRTQAAAIYQAFALLSISTPRAAVASLRGTVLQSGVGLQRRCRHWAFGFRAQWALRFAGLSE